jgi:hypothetical protein
MGQFEKGHGGFKIASSDPAVVTSWKPAWRRPDVTVGMATGTTSRLVVIDIDLKPRTEASLEEDGSLSVSEMLELDMAPVEDLRGWAREKDVVLPGNVQVETPSGGLHVWMRTDAAGARRIRWRPNIDLLWDKHSIKAPPSTRPTNDRKRGGEYTFKRGCPCEVPEAPVELVEALRNSPTTGRVGRSGRGSAGVGDFVPSADGLGPKIDIETPKRVGIPMGQQNTGFWEIACSHAGRGLPPGEAVQALVETLHASEQDDSWPWELDDLSDIVERAYLWKAEDRASFRAFAAKIKF